MKIVAKSPAKLILLSLALAICCVTVVYAEPIVLSVYELNIQVHFNNWRDNPYVAGQHDCSDMSREVEEYVETELGFECYIVIGNNGNESHAWNLVCINNEWYEFESTSLSFSKTSNKYDVTYAIEGDYINGEYYERAPQLDKIVEDWEELI